MGAVRVPAGEAGPAGVRVEHAVCVCAGGGVDGRCGRVALARLCFADEPNIRFRVSQGRCELGEGRGEREKREKGEEERGREQRGKERIKKKEKKRNRQELDRKNEKFRKEIWK